MNKARVLRFIAVLLLAPHAFASEPISIEDALILAAVTHPSVVSRSRERDVAAGGLEAARWQRFPQLSAQSTRDANDRYVTTASIEQPIWTGGRITAGIAEAQARLEYASASIAEAQESIMLRAAQAFVEYGLAQDRMAEATNNVAEHLRLSEMMERRVASQVSAETDRVLALARLNQARAELAQIESVARRARIQLEQAVGHPVHGVSPPGARAPSVPDLAQAVDAAVGHSPLLRLRAAQEVVAQAEIDVQRGNLYPRVSVRYDRSFGGSASDSRIYVALTYQSGAGLSSMAAVREAASRLDAAQANREAAYREVVESVSSDWSEYAFQADQVSNLTDQAEGTRQVFDSFVRQFAVGRKSWLDVLNAQRESTTARYATADAQWRALGAALRLQIRTGELTLATLSPGNRDRQIHHAP